MSTCAFSCLPMPTCTYPAVHGVSAFSFFLYIVHICNRSLLCPCASALLCCLLPCPPSCMSVLSHICAWHAHSCMPASLFLWSCEYFFFPSFLFFLSFFLHVLMIVPHMHLPVPPPSLHPPSCTCLCTLTLSCLHLLSWHGWHTCQRTAEACAGTQ